MAAILRFEDIEGWRKSLALYEAFSPIAASAAFKDSNLKDQMRRAVESAMANIVEGFDSGSNPEFVRFLNMAYRSLTEFQSHLYVCKHHLFVSGREFGSLYQMAKEAKSKVGAFIRYLKAHPRGKSKEIRKTRPNPERRTNAERRTNPELRTPNSPYSA
jgi:four helix bundle protein